jgi:hypothetical protein
MQGVNGGPSLETVSLSHLSRSTAAFAVEGLVQAQQAQQPAHRISEDGTRRSGRRAGRHLFTFPCA